MTAESNFNAQIDMKKTWNEINENIKNSAVKCGRDPEDISVIAVAKTKPVELIKLALEAGIENIGENYVQELSAKHREMDYLSYNPKWHFIGHLQRNKVKSIVEFISLIHSVDSFPLAKEISRQAEKINKKIDILLQINSSAEESKFGCPPNQAAKLFEEVSTLKNISIKGLMTIGSFSNDETVTRKEFKLLNKVFEELNKNLKENRMRHLSMGMSGDYQIAIEEGATLLRIGTTIFGERNYNK